MRASAHRLIRTSPAFQISILTCLQWATTNTGIPVVLSVSKLQQRRRNRKTNRICWGPLRAHRDTGYDDKTSNSREVAVVTPAARSRDHRSEGCTLHTLNSATKRQFQIFSNLTPNSRISQCSLALLKINHAPYIIYPEGHELVAQASRLTPWFLLVTRGIWLVVK